MKGKISIFLTALCLGLTGCITPPRGLENEQFSITSYKEITSQDLSCHCKNIRLGGKVVQTTIYLIILKSKYLVYRYHLYLENLS